MCHVPIKQRQTIPGFRDWYRYWYFGCLWIDTGTDTGTQKSPQSIPGLIPILKEAPSRYRYWYWYQALNRYWYWYRYFYYIRFSIFHENQSNFEFVPPLNSGIPSIDTGTDTETKKSPKSIPILIPGLRKAPNRYRYWYWYQVSVSE